MAQSPINKVGARWGNKERNAERKTEVAITNKCMQWELIWNQRKIGLEIEITLNNIYFLKLKILENTL